jgi:glucosamine--fructose-6-phosphate aminotransferase (isomerizing)
MMAMKIGKAKGTLAEAEYNRLLGELALIPEKVKTTLATHEAIKAVAKHYSDARDFLFLGRGYNFPVALEGALKLKEISYIHAEGYPAAEMKHGPIALVDENLPVLFIATKDAYYEKIVSNIQEIKARKGKVIAVISEGDTLIRSMADHVMVVPEVDELLAPLISVLPTQLLSYYIGVERGLDVDKPRNLAKSVTVE